MKNMNLTNCTSYSNGVNSPLEYLNITTPAEFKVVMDLLCYYDSEKKNATISRPTIARDTAMSVSNVERALKTLAQKDIIRIHNNYADNGRQVETSIQKLIVIGAVS